MRQIIKVGTDTKQVVFPVTTADSLRLYFITVPAVVRVPVFAPRKAVVRVTLAPLFRACFSAGFRTSLLLVVRWLKFLAADDTGFQHIFHLWLNVTGAEFKGLF